ncbi:sensor histidine kinase [Parvibaculum sp.]|uniref:sensor histidine kinase n=1 Tax=Parvibaculum sp. TaxID=2024848 RepID=UPI003BAD08FF
MLRSRLPTLSGFRHLLRAARANIATTRRINAWLLTLALLLLCAAAAASLVLASRAQQTADAVAQTIAIRVEFHTTFSLIQDMETGQRGFLLTRDPKYLDPYYSARMAIERKLTLLERDVGDRPSQHQRVKALRDVAEKRIEILDRTISQAGAGSFDEAIAEVGSDRGHTLMAEGRDIVERALREEAKILVGRQEAAANSYKLLSLSLIGAIAAALLLTLLAFRTTLREFRSIANRRDQLALLNEELEARVRERTHELEIARKMAESEAGRAEYERGRVELLLREVTHRVGNNLAMVSSLLRMQQAKLEDDGARSALETARGRIQTISTAQRRLRLGDDLQSTRADSLLEAVVSDLADAALESSTITISSSFAPLIVSARDATTLAVVLGELVSNAIKHAFEGLPDGTISVSFAINDDGVPVMSVQDDGVGIDEPENAPARRSGLGSMIIENLSRQYGGEIKKWKNESGGTSIHILLPKLQIMEGEKMPEDRG